MLIPQDGVRPSQGTSTIRLIDVSNFPILCGPVSREFFPQLPVGILMVGLQNMKSEFISVYFSIMVVCCKAQPVGENGSFNKYLLSADTLNSLKCKSVVSLPAFDLSLPLSLPFHKFPVLTCVCADPEHEFYPGCNPL